MIRQTKTSPDPPVEVAPQPFRTSMRFASVKRAGTCALGRGGNDGGRAPGRSLEREESERVDRGEGSEVHRGRENSRAKRREEAKLSIGSSGLQSACHHTESGSGLRDPDSTLSICLYQAVGPFGNGFGHLCLFPVVHVVGVLDHHGILTRPGPVD